MDGIQYSHTKDDSTRTEPSLKEMTMKALDLLSKDKDGFFLMVEGGRIDWAGHDNDAGTMLHEMLKFDDAIAAVHEWVKNRKDTLVVITADHETGSFGFSYSRQGLPAAKPMPNSEFGKKPYKPNFNFGNVAILDGLYDQKISFSDMMRQFDKGDKAPKSLVEIVNANSDFDIDVNQAKRILSREANTYRVKGNKYLDVATFPRVKEFKAFYVYGNEIRNDLIGRELSEQQNVVWGTGTHTNTPVAVIAWGPENATAPFAKMLRHTEVGQLLKRAVKNAL